MNNPNDLLNFLRDQQLYHIERVIEVIESMTEVDPEVRAGLALSVTSLARVSVARGALDLGYAHGALEYAKSLQAEENE